MPTYTERAPGVYRARFTGVNDKTITDKESGEEVARWLWTWQETADPTTMGQLDTLTSPHFKSRSNGLKLFTGMLGRAPKEGDTTEALVGQEYDVQYGPNQAGRYTVVGATKPVGGKDLAALRAERTHAAQEGEDHVPSMDEGLPF